MNPEKERNSVLDVQYCDVIDVCWCEMGLRRCDVASDEQTNSLSSHPDISPKNRIPIYNIFYVMYK